MLAPTLFGLFFALMLIFAFGDSMEGIYIRTRDGKLYSLSRLRAKTKVLIALIRDLLFADDAAIVVHSEEQLQKLMDKLPYSCKAFGLTISIKKTEVLTQGVIDHPPIITVDDKVLKNVDKFTYLGSTVTSKISLTVEINSRIGKATGVFSNLEERVWTNRNLSISTRVAVYKACVLSTLLYSSETWTTYAKDERRLNSYHLRCLRRILGIQWEDRIPNTEVLDRANSTSIQSMLCLRRLRWFGHVRRMKPERIPKQLLYGELSDGTRPAGRPILRYKDVCKRDLKSAGIDVETWEKTAADRPAWRRYIRNGVLQAETRRNSEESQEREDE